VSGFINRLHLALLGIGARARERRRWRGRSAPAGPPHVFYGTDRLPGRGEIATGGIVKCQDLAAIFPNDPERPNIVYLVSSALPLEAPHLARLARRRGARVVLNQNGVAYPAWHGPGWERTNRPMAAVLAMADHVFFQRAFCKMAADRFLGDRQGPWEVLHNPVDTGFFTPPDQPAAGGPILLCAGSHQSFYRVQVAIETLALVSRQFRDARLVIAGGYRWQPSEDRSLEEARRCAASLGVERSVEFRGPYTQEQAPALFGGAHLLLHTKFADPCPRVVVEAMACGLPVAYSATGGVPELVGDDAGVGVPGPVDWEHDHPPSPGALAAGALTILRSHGRYAAAARSRAVERFDVGPWLERHREIFARLASPGAAA
jgi:glycosyltransferase involved in cell wall biosynthesis